MFFRTNPSGVYYCLLFSILSTMKCHRNLLRSDPEISLQKQNEENTNRKSWVPRPVYQPPVARSRFLWVVFPEKKITKWRSQKVISDSFFIQIMFQKCSSEIWSWYQASFAFPLWAPSVPERNKMLSVTSRPAEVGLLFWVCLRLLYPALFPPFVVHKTSKMKISKRSGAILHDGWCISRGFVVKSNSWVHKTPEITISKHKDMISRWNPVH